MKIFKKWWVWIIIIVFLSILLVNIPSNYQGPCHDHKGRISCFRDKQCSWQQISSGGEFADFTKYNCCPKEEFVPEKGEECGFTLVD